MPTARAVGIFILFKYFTFIVIFMLKSFIIILNLIVGEINLMKKIALLALATILLSGCAVTNDQTKWRGIGLTFNANIKDIGDGKYLAAVEAAPAAGRKQGAEGYALMNATKFCHERDQNVKVLDTKLSSHLQNGVANLTFSCVSN